MYRPFYTTKEDEMVIGYRDGVEGSDMRRNSPAYTHGYKNGLDDANRSPRERADVLRRRAGMILSQPLPPPPEDEVKG